MVTSLEGSHSTRTAGSASGMIAKFIVVFACYVHVILLATSMTTDCDLISNLQFKEEKVYSQNGEDGVLLALLSLIRVKYYTFVEFGVENGFECNSRILRENFSFQGLMMDGGFENLAANLQKEFITERNILDLFEKHGVQKDFDVLSVDVDMFDYWILARILSGNYRPRIIIVETNPTLCYNTAGFGRKTMRDYSRVNSMPLTVMHPNMTDQTMWDKSRYSGANPLSFLELGKQYGYEMLYCERCGVNCFLVLRSEMPEACQRDYYLPTVPYPCYGTYTPELVYPGHFVDPQERSAVLISPELLLKVKADDFTISDIQASMVPCESNYNSSTIFEEYDRSKYQEEL